MQSALIITTINPPRDEIFAFSKLSDWQLICVGDKKSPTKWEVKNVVYLSSRDQEKLFPSFSSVLPWNCYGRKNMGYLYAIKNKFPLIAETDDDVFPYKNFPPEITKRTKTTLLSGEKFINIYNYFGRGMYWPRGFPLEWIKKQVTIKEVTKSVYTPIQNSVIDQDSDFDAIYRLISDKPVKFRKTGNSYALNKGNYSPLNSQNTFFFPEAYPLLYMPSFVNPRIEDIFRGYIAQRILWEIGGNLLFTPSTTYTSNRNAHNYIKDFEQELPLYLQTTKLIAVLDSLSLSADISKSLIKVYIALAKEDLMKKEEVIAVKTWVKQIEKYL